MSRSAEAAPVREARSTRDAILDAAERAFAEKGFTGVSVREISSEVGLRNQASLYHHFRDKRAIYEAVLSRGVERLVDLVTEARGLGDVLDDVIGYLAEHPHLPRLIQRAGLDDRDHLGETAARLLTPLYEEGIRELAEMESTWKPADLPHVAAGLYNVIFGYFANAGLFAAVRHVDLDARESMERQRRFARAAVMRLLEGPGPARVPASRRAR